MFVFFSIRPIVPLVNLHAAISYLPVIKSYIQLWSSALPRYKPLLVPSFENYTFTQLTLHYYSKQHLTTKVSDKRRRFEVILTWFSRDPNKGRLNWVVFVLFFSHRGWMGGGGGGGTPIKWSGPYGPLPKSLYYPISDQNLRFSLPYFTPNQKCDTQLQTYFQIYFSCYRVVVIIWEELLLMVLPPNDKEVAFSKKHTLFKIWVHKSYPISGQNG